MKSVYSLMLDDGVVAAIDRLAYLQNTNRSGLVAPAKNILPPGKRLNSCPKASPHMVDLVRSNSGKQPGVS